MAVATKQLNIAIIGCGLIGQRRAAQVVQDQQARLLYAVDIDERNVEALKNQYHCHISCDWKQIVASSEIDAVIVSTPNHLLAEIAVAALRNGKHVLVEKPLGRNATEAAAIVSAARQSQDFLVLKTGFNHRFHPAISKAKSLVEDHKIGKILSIRARYGHGGRPGMEKEWRASKTLCGGGELLDQGVHLIDLIQWFGGDMVHLFGKVETKFWDMDVEDNAFVIAETAQNVSVQFHVSWTNWRNIFSFEIFGDKGYVNINGLGGNYGVESLELGIRKPKGGKPDITFFEYPDEDTSWKLEWNEFVAAILERRVPLGNGEDGLMANRVIEAIYKSDKQGKAVDV